MSARIEDDMNANNGSAVRRSISSFGLNANVGSGVREAKSFTGALHELKSTGSKHSIMQQHDPNYYMKLLSDPTVMAPHESAFVTKQKSSDNVFVVPAEMLTYRGKQYSVNDIATRWKKDCRMWLWKGSNKSRQHSVGDVREKSEKVVGLRLPNSSDHLKHPL